MGFKKEFFVDCVGAVTILTDDRVIFQGQIIKDDEPRHHEEEKCVQKVEVEARLENDPEFIVLRLTCDPAIIRDNATIPSRQGIVDDLEKVRVVGWQRVECVDIFPMTVIVGVSEASTYGGIYGGILVSFYPEQAK